MERAAARSAWQSVVEPRPLELTPNDDIRGGYAFQLFYAFQSFDHGWFRRAGTGAAFLDCSHATSFREISTGRGRDSRRRDRLK